jgi:hypothetical protein
MRRALAILLALFFSLGPLAAALGAENGSRLPACCRRDGKHHCAMSEQAMAGALATALGSELVFSAPAHCPFYPHVAAAWLAPNHALAAPTVALPFPVRLSRIACAVSARILPTPLRARAGRGPPQPTQS